jgi:hypothetical protein
MKSLGTSLLETFGLECADMAALSKVLAGSLYKQNHSLPAPPPPQKKKLILSFSASTGVIFREAWTLLAFPLFWLMLAFWPFMMSFLYRLVATTLALCRRQPASAECGL